MFNATFAHKITFWDFRALMHVNSDGHAFNHTHTHTHTHTHNHSLSYLIKRHAMSKLITKQTQINLLDALYCANINEFNSNTTTYI